MCEIKSLTDFVTQVTNLNAGRAELFFRGEDRYFKQRVPSLYRVKDGEIAESSDEYYQRLFSEVEDTTLSKMTSFQKLSELQHFGALTRFIDVTSDALVALFFAVEDGDLDAKSNKDDGYVFVYQNPAIKTDTGHTANIKAAVNFMKPYKVRAFINNLDEASEFNYERDYGRDFNKEHLKQIKQSIDKDTSKQQQLKNEQTLFCDHLSDLHPTHSKYNKIDDIQKTLKTANLFLASKINSRISHQHGAFIAPAFEEFSSNCGLDENKRLINNSIERLSLQDETKAPVIFKIDKDAKPSIKSDLALLGVNSGTVYPDIQHQSEYIIHFLAPKTKSNKADDELQNQAIEQLHHSPSFQTTHDTIKVLTRFSSWSEKQLANLRTAYANSQVSLIKNDQDVALFYHQLAEYFISTKISNSVLADFYKQFND